MKTKRTVAISLLALGVGWGNNPLFSANRRASNSQKQESTSNPDQKRAELVAFIASLHDENIRLENDGTLFADGFAGKDDLIGQSVHGGPTTAIICLHGGMGVVYRRTLSRKYFSDTEFFLETDLQHEKRAQLFNRIKKNKAEVPSIYQKNALEKIMSELYDLQLEIEKNLEDISKALTEQNPTIAIFSICNRGVNGKERKSIGPEFWEERIKRKKDRNLKTIIMVEQGKIVAFFPDKYQNVRFRSLSGDSFTFRPEVENPRAFGDRGRELGMLHRYEKNPKTRKWEDKGVYTDDQKYTYSDLGLPGVIKDLKRMFFEGKFEHEIQLTMEIRRSTLSPFEKEERLRAYPVAREVSRLLEVFSKVETLFERNLKRGNNVFSQAALSFSTGVNGIAPSK